MRAKEDVSACVLVHNYRHVKGACVSVTPSGHDGEAREGERSRRVGRDEERNRRVG